MMIRKYQGHTDHIKVINERNQALVMVIRRSIHLQVIIVLVLDFLNFFILNITCI